MRAKTALILAAFALVVAPWPTRVAARDAAPLPSVVATAVDGVSMTVSDMDRAVDFYTRVLSFAKETDEEIWGDEIEHLSGVFGARARVVRLRLGAEQVELVEYLAPKGRPIPVDSRSNDGWFQHVAIIVSDMDRAYAWLREHHVEHASPAPQRLPDWNPNAGGIRAFYFKDPDGHPLEVLWFPPGKGGAKWHEPTDRLFLGIDHTAIVVADTDRSLAFYRDALGLRVAGESDNYGIEQERLNNVFGAHLRITGLRAGSGIGVEFLEYLAPRDGRPFPSDERANDVVHRQTEIAVSSAEAAAAALRARRFAFVSSGVISFSKPALNRTRATLVRDPDGHAVELIER